MESVKESLMRFYATHKDYDTVEDIFVKYSAGFKKIQEGDPKETGLNFVFEDEISLNQDLTFEFLKKSFTEQNLPFNFTMRKEIYYEIICRNSIDVKERKKV